jgi:hypothetical protein
VALAACNKEKTLQPTQPAAETKAISNSVKKEKPRPPKMFHAQYNQKTGNCWWWFGNCIVIETITVKPHAAVLVFNAGNSGSAGEVASTFSREELGYLVEYCLTENGYAAKLQSGSYYITRTSDNGKEACYIAGTQYPVTAENMEFAFQFAYGEIEE